MEQEAKIDLILSKVSNMETKMALIEERDKTLNARVDNHEERHEKTEATIIEFKTERSNIISVMKVVGKVVAWVGGGIAFTIMILNFFHK